MGTLKNQKEDSFFMLLWGPGKVGKTVLASQFPSPFFIDMDQGIGSVRKLLSDLKIDVDFDVISLEEGPIEDEDFTNLCGKTLARNGSGWRKAKSLVETLCRKLPQDATLVIDHLTRMGEFLMHDIESTTKHRPLQIQDWGTFTSEMQDVVNALRRSKCHKIVIGHENVRTDDLTNTLLRRLLLPSSMRDRWPSAVGEYLYMYTDVRGGGNKRRTVRVLQSLPDPNTPTGGRSRIPDLENPTYEQLKPYLSSYLNRELPKPTWTPPTESTNKKEAKNDNN